MSMSADFGAVGPDQPSEYIATNRGYVDLCDWADTLDQEKYSRFVGLLKDGWDDELDLTIDDLKEAIKECPPPGDVAHTADVLLAALVKHEDTKVVVLTDGCYREDVGGGSPGDDDSEDEPEADDDSPDDE